MVGVPLLLDTNVLIYALNENRPGADAILALNVPGGLAISLITWMEVVAGTPAKFVAGTRRFLEIFAVLDIDREIAEKAALIRRDTKLKLPDAVIYATALVSRRTLVTYNTRDFPQGTPSVHIPSF